MKTKAKDAVVAMGAFIGRVRAKIDPMVVADVLGALVGGVVVVLIVSAWIALPPIGAIWSVNTLYPPAAIPINSHTVVAAWFLLFVLRSRKTACKE